MEADVPDHHPSAEQYQRASQHYAELAGALTRLDIRTSELDHAVEQYGQLIELTAKATREAGEAQASGDRDKERARELELRRLQYRHYAQTKRIEYLCHAP